MATKVGIYVGGDLQYEFEPHNKGDDWVLTPQRGRRPISPGGAELRVGSRVIGHIIRVTAKGLRWLITFEPAPVVVKKAAPKSRRKKPVTRAPEVAPKKEPGEFSSPVSEDES